MVYNRDEKNEQAKCSNPNVKKSIARIGESFRQCHIRFQESGRVRTARVQFYKAIVMKICLGVRRLF